MIKAGDAPNRHLRLFIYNSLSRWDDGFSKNSKNNNSLQNFLCSTLSITSPRNRSTNFNTTGFPFGNSLFRNSICSGSSLLHILAIAPCIILFFSKTVIGNSPFYHFTQRICRFRLLYEKQLLNRLMWYSSCLICVNK